MNVCYDCKKRLRKNEGVTVYVPQKLGKPLPRKLCDVCCLIRNQSYKLKYYKSRSEFL